MEAVNTDMCFGASMLAVLIASSTSFSISICKLKNMLVELNFRTAFNEDMQKIYEFLSLIYFVCVFQLESFKIINENVGLVKS